jgi:hypothetical protein
MIICKSSLLHLKDKLIECKESNTTLNLYNLPLFGKLFQAGDEASLDFFPEKFHKTDCEACKKVFADQFAKFTKLAFENKNKLIIKLCQSVYGIGFSEQMCESVGSNFIKLFPKTRSRLTPENFERDMVLTVNCPKYSSQEATRMISSITEYPKVVTKKNKNSKSKAFETHEKNIENKGLF